MEGISVSLEDAANIVTLIFPGYVAVRTYGLIYAKKERGQPALLIESVVVSLPIVAFADFLWIGFFNKAPISTNLFYIMSLVVLGVVASAIFSILRRAWPLNHLAKSVGIDSPDEDFMRSQFAKLKATNAVATVTLKNGEIFSGIPVEGKVFRRDAPREYRWDNLAWYNKKTGEWDFRDGSLIINLDEVQYIEVSASDD